MFICGDCGVYMKCRKTGAAVLEFNEEMRATALWQCDVYECPVCETQIAQQALKPYMRRDEDPEAFGKERDRLAVNPAEIVLKVRQT